MRCREMELSFLSIEITNSPPGSKIRSNCPGKSMVPDATNRSLSQLSPSGNLSQRIRSFAWRIANRLRASVGSAVGEGIENLSATDLCRWFCVWSIQTWRLSVDLWRSLHVWSDFECCSGESEGLGCTTYHSEANDIDRIEFPKDK